MVSLAIPLRLSSGLNRREHWAVRAKRTKQERQLTRLVWRAAGSPVPSFPTVVRIVRLIGPRGRALDVGEGEAAAAKAIRDELAECWGLPHDRGGPEDAVQWAYAQERASAWGVRVEWEG